MSRLAEVFEQARKRGHPAIIPFIVAGDPDVASTLAVVNALGQAGADIVELGIPYGDPLADGPTIQAAAQRALASGTSVDDVLDLSARIDGPAVVLFTYFNPILQYGLQRFAERAASARVAAVIVPDIPYEETAELADIFGRYGIDVPLLIAPTTPFERARDICERAAGFIYVVSRLGVTGATSTPDARGVLEQIERLRRVTSKPLAVGFGISSADHVRRIAPHVDGVIIGSALIDAYCGCSGETAARRAREFLDGVLAGTVPVPP